MTPSRCKKEIINELAIYFGLGLLEPWWNYQDFSTFVKFITNTYNTNNIDVILFLVDNVTYTNFLIKVIIFLCKIKIFLQVQRYLKPFMQKNFLKYI